MFASTKAAALLLAACCVFAGCVNEAELEWRIEIEDAIEELKKSVEEKLENMDTGHIFHGAQLIGIEQGIKKLARMTCFNFESILALNGSLAGLSARDPQQAADRCEELAEGITAP